MKITSAWATLGLSRRRMVILALAAGTAATACVLASTLSVLGTLSILLAMVVGAAASYLIAAFPQHSLDRSALVQAREAPTLAAAAAVYLQSTGSRAKTILMLHSEEPRFSELIEGAKRSTLLGIDAETAFGEAEIVRSDSTAAIVSSVVRAHGDKLSDGGEELEGMVRASLSTEETKFPVFLTISFFIPIMMMLLAAVGHHDDPASVMSLSILEIVILDLALSFTATERKRLSA